MLSRGVVGALALTLALALALTLTLTLTLTLMLTRPTRASRSYANASRR